MTWLKELAPADEVIERLTRDKRTAYLALLAKRCIESIWLIGGKDALRSLKGVTDVALSCERGFYDRDEPAADAPSEERSGA